MTCVMIDYHGHTEELCSVDDAAEWFDEQAGSVFPTGRSGQAIWYGPAGRAPELRVDIDIDADRAALTWLPDDSYAHQPTPGRPITVLVSADGDQLTIGPDRALVDVATARAAVLEYAATGHRPAATDWLPA